ncbi:MAG: DNA-binding GntR family transcriptional regulator [Alteromonas macleodii]|jgi:DNA-binding GntR family transcriptional regulator
MIQPSTDAHIKTLEKAQNALEKAVSESDFDAADRINSEMDLQLRDLYCLPFKQPITNQSRLAQISTRHQQAQVELAQKVLDVQRRLRRNQTIIAAYSKS